MDIFLVEFQANITPGRILQTSLTRYCTKPDVAEKGRKAVGYWLLGCSGMVFVAVVLGGIVCYGFVLYCVCIVMAEIVYRTAK